MPNTKPLVALACICEKVLIEKDGVMSAIRIVDTFFFEPTPREEGVGNAIELTSLVVLKSGDVQGKSSVSVQFRRPNGDTVKAPQSWEILLNGGEHGANLRLTFVIPAEFGLHWMDVYWQNEILTSVPFKLVEAPRPAVTTGPDSTKKGADA